MSKFREQASEVFAVVKREALAIKAEHPELSADEAIREAYMRRIDKNAPDVAARIRADTP